MELTTQQNEEINKYISILILWQQKLNLIAPSAISNIWDRHILDCLQLKNYISLTNQNIYDLGSGAGLPGIVLAIIDKNNQYKLIESDQRKSVFLSTIKRELKLNNVEVINNRIEEVIEVNPHSADIIISRALASLDKLIDFSKDLIKPKGYCLFLKGKNYQEEIDQLLVDTYKLDLINSMSNEDSKIIKVIF